MGERLFLRVLIYFLLMTNDVEHIFICLLAICIILFCTIVNSLDFVFSSSCLLLIYSGQICSLCFPYMSPFLDIGITNICPYSGLRIILKINFYFRTVLSLQKNHKDSTQHSHILYPVSSIINILHY